MLATILTENNNSNNNSNYNNNGNNNNYNITAAAIAHIIFCTNDHSFLTK